ncbi:ferlin family C2 domain-containing myoferlin misfire [Haematobia irritans]|uniref:ferlin family C2 domain-containing myoferlin misfire n=1 Tax=Haematobia irritans TaxID=7368 RepID=UPI003F4FA52D
MQSVWHQKNHFYFKKWGRLETSIEQQQQHQLMAKDNSTESRGFLQIDLAIVSQANNPQTLLRPYDNDEDLMSMTNVWQINHDYDDIEKNLLDNIDLETRCNIRYILRFYSGVMVTKSDYIIQFRFHPFKGKTKVAKNTQYPVWNQEIQFAWIYPSPSQTCLIQLLSQDHLQWKCLAEYEIHFEDISFKDKPVLGPTFIHFYDSLNPSIYQGRLLIEILSDCLTSPPQRQLHMKSVMPLDETRYWHEDIFLVELLILKGDFIHGTLSNCKIYMKFANHTSNNLECFVQTYATQKNETIAKMLKYFQQEAPYKAITMRLKLPDHRHKYESERFLRDILDFMKREIIKFQEYQIFYRDRHYDQLKVLRSIIIAIMDKVKTALEIHRLEYRGPKEPTQWDVKRLLYLQDYFIKFWSNLKDIRSHLRLTNNKSIDEVLQDLIKLVQNLQNLAILNNLQDQWPNLILIFSAGNKDCGYCYLDAKTFQFLGSETEDNSNDQCWKIRNFIFKGIQCRHTCNNCGCIVAILYGCLSITNEKERPMFLNQVKHDWINPEPFYWKPNNVSSTILKCRVFIHQAKIRPGSDRSGLCDPYVRVMIASHSSQTQVLYATLSPAWDAVISIDSIFIPGNFQNNSPLLAIELYDIDKRKSDDYLGCGWISPNVISMDMQSIEEIESYNQHITMTDALDKFNNLINLSPPPLKWIPMALNGIIKAEILMSAELIKLPRNDMMGEMSTKPLVVKGIPTSIKPNIRNYILEVTFAGLRNYTKSSVPTGKHRIKLMMGDLLLTSGLSSYHQKHSINFLFSYASGVVSLPEQFEYWPAMIVTDVVVTTQDEDITLGATLIATSKKYLQTDKELKCKAKELASEESEVESEWEYTSPSISLEENESQLEPLLPTNLSTTRTFWTRTFRENFITRVPEINDPYGLNDIIDEKEYTWWTKFYNSMSIVSNNPLSRFKHKLVIYPNELEKQTEFSHLHDWAEPFPVVHGVRHTKNSLPKEEIYATLKMKINITACQCENSEELKTSILKPLTTVVNPRYQDELKSLAEMVQLVVRVYVVQGLHLRPAQKHGQADAYVRVELGQTQQTNRAEYIPNESNPVFGKCFQLKGLIPREHNLEISVFNRHLLRDEPVGSTKIDIEDRWRSKHRATVGIPNEFSSFGYNKWRDSKTPRHILQELCIKNGLKIPSFIHNEIHVDGKILEDETEIATDEDLQERLSLTALKNLQHLPSFGYQLIPEYVETRPLYRPECPGIEQGKIQLWVELFDGTISLPPVIDITPQPPELYELRVVIFGVSDVLLDERNIFGTAMSDIYVKGWCSNPDAAQITDIHYRSLDGEGQFNWRMVFTFKYSIIEDMMLVKRKTGLMDEYESKQPPILFLQIWDDDIISKDDFLGSLEINLSNFPQPFETAKKCQLEPHDNLMTSLLAHGPQMNRMAKPAGQPLKLVNIFRHKKVRGWFPVRGYIPELGNKAGLAGKIELELEVLTEKEAALYPVGLGRNPPNPLPEPKRPDSSFNPFANPWKSFKKIVVPSVWKYVLIIFLLTILGISIFMLVVNFPIFLKTWSF